MLNSYQQKAFEHEAKQIASKKKEEGYLPLDLVALGYYLIKNNIDSAEKMEENFANMTELLQRAESLMEES